MKRNLPIVWVLLVIYVLSGPADAGAETFERGHQQLYATGEVLKVSELVDLTSVGDGSVVSVSIRYNMVRSALEVEWLYNGQVIGHTVLDKGRRTTASFDYEKRLPGSIELRFVGPAGHVQVLVIKVIAQPAPELVAGSGAITTANGDAVLVGEGVSPAVTPTPRQLEFIEPTLILPVDPKADGFDDSICERLVCMLPPWRMQIGDTGQNYVSSFYLFIQHAAKPAREQMPAEGFCAWWDRPMTGDDSYKVVGVAFNTRIDIEIRWTPEITYSFRPQRANIRKDPDEPARFIRLWDSVMAGGFLDLCVVPRKTDSGTILAVVGQY